MAFVVVVGGLAGAGAGNVNGAWREIGVQGLGGVWTQLTSALLDNSRLLDMVDNAPSLGVGNHAPSLPREVIQCPALGWSEG